MDRISWRLGLSLEDAVYFNNAREFTDISDEVWDTQTPTRIGDIIQVWRDMDDMPIITKTISNNTVRGVLTTIEQGYNDIIYPTPDMVYIVYSCIGGIRSRERREELIWQFENGELTLAKLYPEVYFEGIYRIENRIWGISVGT